MTAETLVAALEQEGVRLRVEGEKLKLEAPANKVPGAGNHRRPTPEQGRCASKYLRERVATPRNSVCQFCRTLYPEKLTNWKTGWRSPFARSGGSARPHDKAIPVHRAQGEDTRRPRHSDSRSMRIA